MTYLGTASAAQSATLSSTRDQYGHEVGDPNYLPDNWQEEGEPAPRDQYGHEEGDSNYLPDDWDPCE